MFKRLMWLVLLFVPLQLLEAADATTSRIRAADFPTVAVRAAFFEERLNATDSRIRERALRDVTFSIWLPDEGYVRLLKRMMRDPDPFIRGEAIRSLHDKWVPIEVRELPETFMGSHLDQIINLKDKNQVPQLIAECRGGGTEGAFAAYPLGLLRCEQAIPALVRLGEDPNEFAKYEAARALLDCGAKKEAGGILQQLISQRSAQWGYEPGKSDPYYAVLAARATMEIEPDLRKECLRRLVSLLGELEPSKDINDANRLEDARRLLAEVTGHYFTSHREALDWVNAKQGSTTVGGIENVPTQMKSADYPTMASRVAFFEERFNAADPRIRKRALYDATIIGWCPAQEYVRFLKRILRDPASDIRGEAVLKLHELWIPLEVQELPETFTGMYPDQLINRSDKNLVARLIAQCRDGDKARAAYALGLLQCKQAIPDLIELGKSLTAQVQYEAARALLGCGARNEAKIILQELISKRTNAKKYYGSYNASSQANLTIAQAARTMTELGPEERKDGLRRLVSLLAEMEALDDLNNIHDLETVRFLLAQVTGRYFASHREALDWLNRNEGGAPK